MILDPETQALLKRHEELHGKKKVSDVLKALLQAHLAEKDPAQRATVPVHHRVKLSLTRHIPKWDREYLQFRSEGQCEWQHPETGERCESRHRLQYDHYPTPFAKGGPSIWANLRLACPAHNARHAVKSYRQISVSTEAAKECGGKASQSTLTCRRMGR